MARLPRLILPDMSLNAAIAANRSSSRGSVATVTYDALGRRASKTVNGTTTKYIYDGADLITETNNAGTVTSKYLFGARLDEPLELKRGTTTSYYTPDGLGSTVHLTTTTGAIAESYTYDLFGTPTIKNAGGTAIPASALGNPFLFTGREWDSEFALYYYRARYYKPGIGRFLSRDPLGYLVDINLYRYVLNNPVRFTDPNGLAYFAKRPLRGQSGMCNTAFGDFLNLEWSHEHLFFEDGLDPPNMGFGPEGVFVENDPSVLDDYVRTSEHYDDALMREAAERVSRGTYFFVGNNCQDWADHVRGEYEKLVPNSCSAK